MRGRRLPCRREPGDTVQQDSKATLFWAAGSLRGERLPNFDDASHRTPTHVTVERPLWPAWYIVAVPSDLLATVPVT